MSKTPLDERIANVLVKNAVNDGFRVAVNEAEETIINPSRNISAITEAMFRSDTDTLTLNVEERHVGIITLIYGKGSGPGVISDHTNVPHINRLVEHTLKELEPSSTPNMQGPDEPLRGVSPGLARRPHDHSRTAVATVSGACTQ